LVSSQGQDEQANDLYVPPVEDKNRNMRMLKITNMEDLVKNSMDILEPAPHDANGNDREDGMEFILILLLTMKPVVPPNLIYFCYCINSVLFEVCTVQLIHF
jgi:hypothetical protein